jgi:hypothetical protein
MASKDERRETAAWCPECKRQFEAFSEADYLWQNFISDLDRAVVTLDSPEIERLETSAEAARKKCQHAKEIFVRHRSTHTHVRTADDRSFLGLT